jgi:DNA-binding NarL/FixJ family response regulator
MGGSARTFVQASPAHARCGASLDRGIAGEARDTDDRTTGDKADRPKVSAFSGICPRDMRRIRVLVVDDHGLMVEAVRLALEREGDIEIVGEARKGADVLPEVARRQPDVVLLDIRMPDVDGLTVLELLRERHPEVKVVMLSAINDPEVAREARARGAVAYLDKGTDPGTLAAALREIVAGANSSQNLPRPTAERTHPSRELLLTDREREILIQVAAGRSNPEIAEVLVLSVHTVERHVANIYAKIARDLFLSEQTIKYHLTNVYRKLGVKSRTGAVRFAFEHALVDFAEHESE